MFMSLKRTELTEINLTLTILTDNGLITKPILLLPLLVWEASMLQEQDKDPILEQEDTVQDQDRAARPTT